MQSLDAFSLVYPTTYGFNDHSFLRADGKWHCFHIWLSAERDRVIGHAISDDLRSWSQQPEILPKPQPPSWEAAKGGNAPYVFEWDGVYYLYYSRYCQINRDGPYRDQQHIGLATSRDLYRWQRYVANPVLTPAPFWSPWEDETSNQYRPKCCRDPHVMRIGDRFVMYYVGMTREPRISAVAHAFSDDLIHWEDAGPVATMEVTTEGTAMCESPCVIEHGGRWHLFFKHGAGTRYGSSDSPFNFPEHELVCPSHAAEVFEWDGDWYMSHCGADAGGLSLARLDMDTEPPELMPI